MNEEKVKLQKGDKVIERDKVDYQKNKKVWEFRGYSLVEDKPIKIKKWKK